MLTVDVQGDAVIVETPDPKAKLTRSEVTTLMGDLLAALQLMEEEKVIPRANWRLPGPGQGRAALPDGRELRVELTQDGWVGYIDERRVGGPEPRKRDAQRKVERELTQ